MGGRGAAWDLLLSILMSQELEGSRVLELLRVLRLPRAGRKRGAARCGRRGSMEAGGVHYSRHQGHKAPGPCWALFTCIPPDLAMLIRGEAFPCAHTRLSLSSPFWTEVAAPAGATGCPVAFGGPWPLLFGVPRRAEL